jgi:uncharacterized protein YbbC (DUF1343 family)
MKLFLKSNMKIFLLLLLSYFAACSGQSKLSLKTGAENIPEYIGLIRGKNIAVVANQTSMVGKVHLVDTLLSLGIKVKLIFAPEHGFRNLADAGETIKDGIDTLTGVSVRSLYGNRLKPIPSELEGIDIVLFDIQDVGARFYTYISTLHLVMESCAENNVKCVILDRPNPNGFYFDGNIPDTSYRSFVCFDPIPVVHGLTIGEYALMVNGEGWLKGGIKCDVTVIKCKNYTHETLYELAVKPSPNLPNQTSVYLYPSLCFFEGTSISIGRGTTFPFQVFGSPRLPDRGFNFTPASAPGAAYPMLLGNICFGTDLRNAIKEGFVPSPKLNLDWVIGAYKDYPDKEKFFSKYFDVLYGGPELREMIIKGLTSEEIRATWEPGLKKYGKMRSKYLLY